MVQSAISSAEPLLRRALLQVVLYGLAAAIALSLARLMDDPDLGWHLRTGEWILEHRALPELELFSANSGGARWVAYSWAYDVLLAALHGLFGIAAPVVLATALAVAIAHALFALLRLLSGRAAPAAALAGLGLVAMGPMLYGRSTMLTILFALLELACLWRALALGRPRALLLVPLVIGAWANVHVQFVHGLFLYACFLAQAMLERRPFAGRMAWVGALCLAATLANPYGVRVYEPLVVYLRQTPVIYRFIRELHPPDFASIDAWATAAIAVLVLARLRVALRRPFLLAAFVVACFVAFRSARDAWFVAVTGLPLAALAFAREGEEPEPAGHPVLVGLGTAAAVLVAVLRLDVARTTLATNQARSFPVDAARFVEEQGLAGPMLNHYDWGGYLTQRLPDRKVSIDGRTWVHPTEYLERSNRVWSAMPGWEDDAELASAGFVIGARSMPLTKALRASPRFRIAYEDEVAAVFLPRKE